MSSANKKKETLTSIIKANLTKPFLTVEILNDFKLCTKEEACSGLKTAFNNVKRWKNYKNIKKLVTAYENFANDFLDSTDAQSFFKSIEVEANLILEEQERDSYHSNVKREYYQKKNTEIRKKRKYNENEREPFEPFSVRETEPSTSKSNSDSEEEEDSVASTTSPDDGEKVDPPSTISADGSFGSVNASFYGDSSSEKAYTLHMDEIDSSAINCSRKIKYYDCSSSFDERLKLSKISLVQEVPLEYELEPATFNSEDLKTFNEWKMCVIKSRLYYPPATTDPSQLNLSMLLTFTMQTILHHKKNERYLVQNPKQSEIDFTVQNIIILFMYLFPANESIYCTWDKSTYTNGNNSKRVTTDFILVSKGQEIGCGEIKTKGTSLSLLEEDRARIAEIMKRQLHVRIMKAKSEKEFITFGIFIYDISMDVYVMRFSKKSGYQLYLLQTITLPTAPTSYSNIDISLAFLLAYKTLITDSLSDDTDINKSYIYHDYATLFKPTVAFRNE